MILNLWRRNRSGNNSKDFQLDSLLVSTYIVCERLSVMHEPAGCGWNFGPNSSRIPPILKYSFRIPPQNENCQRVQIREFQNTPQMKIVRESKSDSFRIPPKWKLSESPNLSEKWKLSESPNPRVSEYPPNENCQRVQIREFQNTPPNENCQRVQIQEFQNTPPKWKLSETPNLRVSEYPPKSEKLQISNFRIV